MTNKQSVEELEEELLKVMQGHFYPEQDGKELIEAYKQAIREEERRDIAEFIGKLDKGDLGMLHELLMQKQLKQE